MKRMNVQTTKEWHKTCKRALMPVMVALLIATACGKNVEGPYYDYKSTVKEYAGNVYEYLNDQQGLYDSLLAVLDRVPKLRDSLRSREVTLFAPTNQSFAIAVQNLNVYREARSLPPLYLDGVDSLQLDTLLSRYILPEKIVPDSLQVYSAGIYYECLNTRDSMNLLFLHQSSEGFLNGGARQIQYSDTKNKIFKRYWVSTVTTSVDHRVKNGVVNVLATGHEFGFGQFTARMAGDTTLIQ